MKFLEMQTYHHVQLYWSVDMQQRIDIINLHIYLGKRNGYDVSQLVAMRQERYLPTPISGVYL